MLSISRNNIKLTRGDTARLSISAKAGKERYVFTATDVLRFTVREEGNDDPGDWVFQITGSPVGDGSDSVMLVDIEPYHTATLEYGIYRFDAELQLNGSPSEVNTIIVGDFELTYEATF